MILSGHEIRRQVELTRITIDPFDDGHINPGSVDLTLGPEVAVYEDFTDCSTADEWQRVTEWRAESRSVSCGENFARGPYDGQGLQPSHYTPGTRKLALDTKKPAKLRKWQMDPEAGWLILPDVGYLMHTVERVHTDHYVPVLDGKSSIGRLFIQVHVTAGYGDAGYDGQYTLEVTSKFPVIVYPGMRFCQMRFYCILGEVLSYRDTGHYQGKQATGAVASRIDETGF